jgi:hypothetical protein
MKTHPHRGSELSFKPWAVGDDSVAEGEKNENTILLTRA